MGDEYLPTLLRTLASATWELQKSFEYEVMYDAVGYHNSPADRSSGARPAQMGSPSSNPISCGSQRAKGKHLRFVIHDFQCALTRPRLLFHP